MKKTKKIIAILVLGVLPLLSANAAGVKEVATGLFVPDYSSQELTSRGCEPTNWNKLVSDYVAKRTGERMLEKAQTDQIIKNAPTAQGGGLAGKAGACFQNAMSQIDGVISTANKVLSIFDGSFSLGALASNLANQYAGQACQQIDYMVGSQVNRALSPVTGVVGTGTNAIYGTNVGGVNVGTSVLGAITPSTGAYQIPYTGSATGISNNSNQTWTGAAQTSAQQQGFFSKMNPFKSDVQNVPDPLK